MESRGNRGVLSPSHDDSEHRPSEHLPESSLFEDERLVSVLIDALGYSRGQEYRGWDYGDGMSSRLRQRLPLDNRWLNLAFQESVKRAPVNVRPWLLVEQRRSYKGVALFALANLNVNWLENYWNTDGTESHVDYRSEATALLDWLVENQSEGYSGFCGGHKHKIQFFHTQGHPNDPDIVSTSFAARALLSGAKYDAEYGDIAQTSIDFVREDLNYREVEGGAKIDYYMNEPDDCYTFNAAALGARLLLDLYRHSNEEELRHQAEGILDYIAARQTPQGGWSYREPASASHLSMDNFHNGYIIEALLRYREVAQSRRYDGVLTDALEFYRSLFEANGAPCRDQSNAYPRDIHDCAQGIIIFSQVGEFESAERILDWALENLYAGNGRFYYQQRRFYTKRITLMRWCQAWMTYALSEHLKRKAKSLDGTVPSSEASLPNLS